MLPVVSGDALTAKVILAHTLLLVGLSFLPVLWSAGLLYLAGAMAGGLLFSWTSIQLVREPTRKRAIQNFLASLLQLVLLLGGTVADRLAGAF